jgi:acyl transferase domain-containing protein
MPEGVAYRDAPIGGELAFVFTGAAASYVGMGRELALALPDMVGRLAERFAGMAEATRWIYGGTAEPRHPLDQLWGSVFVCQLHAEVSRRVLGLTPNATIGYSSGESNALFATGAWRDIDAMAQESRESSVFNRISRASSRRCGGCGAIPGWTGRGRRGASRPRWRACARRCTASRWCT